MADQFYFQGKFFDTSDEMFEYASKWQHESLDQETAEKIFDSLKKDIVLNIFLRGQKFTNREFSNYVEVLFQCAIKLLHKEYGLCQENE